MTSKIKVDNINKVSDDSNIINKCGTTITLGASGDSIALASGASQSGFGREGSVDWQTGSIKSTTFTAVSGEGYFVDTNGGAVTVNLPAGSAGAIVAFADYTRTFATHNLTITPNGSNKIGGIASDAALNVNGQSATFVFVDSTEGWINVQETQTSTTGASNLTATGGTVTTCGNFKIHTFTSPGTFCVSAISTVPAENTVGYLVVAGGGGAGNGSGGGGGAGGFREGRNAPIDNFTASPLVADAPTNAVTVTASSFPITVGAGGGGAAQGPPNSCGAQGNNSIFSTITSAGGGYGAARGNSGANGGSGGGWGGSSGGSGSTGSGNTPPTTPAQGNDAGGPAGPVSAPSGICAGVGGGGATAAGGTWPGSRGVGSNGGAGASSSITGSSVARAGGGGGAARTSPGPGAAGTGGTGGGGNGNSGPGPSTGYPGGNATVNTGGGGGGSAGASTGGSGGSGIVIIRYKFQ